MEGLIGKKVGMTQVFDENGKRICVTVIEVGPCPVVQVKTPERDGYTAVQLGFGSRKASSVSKAVKGQIAKAGIENYIPECIREFRTDDDAKMEIGTDINAGIFAEGEFLDVTGITKGRGYSGVMVRHHFKGGRDGHGGGWHRKPGSIGCRESPGNIIKGKRMAGQLGTDVRTVQNLKIVKLSVEENLIYVSGAIPGPNGGTVLVKKAKKK